VAFGGGEVEVVEAFAGGEGASRAHSDTAPKHARSIRLAAREFGTEIWLAADGYIGTNSGRPESILAHRAPRGLTHEHPL
jgi:hypothetical protein